MLINTEKSSIELSGDIKEYKTSIDPKNLDFITTLLSSNLYSNPEQSFIREIVSNAWDSHVEAGTTDVPVLIKLDTQNNCVTIRDFGTGLSPQRFEEIYCNIGSSTKRDSNDYIGGFGLGRFSSLACSNTTYIDSYHEGTLYKYIMTKSGNSITYNKVLELPTTEKNGVEVSIKDIHVFSKFQDALGYIRFFPNIYVEGYDDINKMKIKNYQYFKCSSMATPYKFLLGNVLYPCKKSNLSTKAQVFMETLRNTGLVIKFNVGELNITPNREEIIYTTETITIIEKRIKEVQEEMYQILKVAFGKDYNDIFEYTDALSSTLYYNFITQETEWTNSAYVFKSADIPSMTITYKGEHQEAFLCYLASLRRCKLPRLKGIVNYETFFTQKIPYSLDKYVSLRSDKIIILKQTDRILSSFKSYLKEYYNNFAVIQSFTVEDILSNIEQYRWRKDASLDFNFLAKEIYDRIMSKAIQIDIATDTKFLKYKEELKENTLKLPVFKKVILYIYNPNSSYYAVKNKHDFSSAEGAMNYLKSIKAGVVVDLIHDENFRIAQFCRDLGYYYIIASQATVKMLKDNPLKNFTTINYILNHNKTLQITHTLGTNNSFLHSSVIRYLPKDLQNKIKEIGKYYKSISIPDFYLDKIPTDIYTKHVIDELKYYSKKYYSLTTTLDTNLDTLDKDIQTALIVKLGLFRVNNKVYIKMKQNKLLQLLCKK